MTNCLFGTLQNNAHYKTIRKRKNKKEKCAQSAVEAIFYTVYFIVGFLIIKEALWIWPSTEWWAAQDQFGKLILPLNIDETTFYIAYASRYFSFFISVFLEHERKDFWEMQIHHVSTITLLYLSFLSGFVRVGFVVMVLLDFADPFLHVAKIFKYIEESRKMAKKQSYTKLASTCADIWFGLFALAFTITRLGLYGYVTWSVWVEATANWVSHEKYGLTKDMKWSTAVRHLGKNQEPFFICQLLISVLYVLMLLWEFYLLTAVWKVISGSGLIDNLSGTDTDKDKDA